MEFTKYQYENIFQVSRKEGRKNIVEVKARIFDPESKESFFIDVTSDSIPDLYTITTQDTLWKSYLDSNVSLQKHSFESIQEYKKFLKDYKYNVLDEEGSQVYKTIDFDGEEIEIPVTEFKDTIFGYQNLSHTFIRNKFKDSEKSNHTHRVWFLDIETRANQAVDHFPWPETAPEEITMIQIYDNFDNMYYIFGRKDFTGAFEKSNVKYIKIAEEKDLLEIFLRLLEKKKPSVISGWNSLGFDMTYITNRIAIVLDGVRATENELKEILNHKHSYKELKNVKRLSPVGIVEAKSSFTMDGMDCTEVKWYGINLIDYRELTIKYGFLGLPSYSLKNVAKHFDLSQKLDNSMYKSFDGFYTGEGWIQPPEDETDLDDIVTRYQLGYKSGKYSKKELQQVVYNRFVDYSLRDVEILVELDELTKYLDSHKQIAYFAGVSMDDNWGTQKHWVSMMYRESLNKGLVLPLKQQYGDESTPWLAGWVRTIPGRYRYISSFDFTSLYPSLIRAWNIGGDTYLKEYQIPQELKDLRDKYFWYFTRKNLNRDEAFGELGETVKKYDDKINDIPEEKKFYLELMENRDIISKTLKKYNVQITPNGYFYRKDTQSIFSGQMEKFFKERLKEKRLGQKYEAILSDTDKDNDKYQEIKQKKEYHENRSIVLKVLLNSAYGVSALSSNPFGQGRITGGSITISGRMSNNLVSMNLNKYIAEVVDDKETVKNPWNMKYIIQADTDSCYVNLGSIIEKKFKNLEESKKIKLLLKLSSEKLQDIINNTIQEIGDTFNLSEPEALKMENEVITESFVSLALKRYFTDVVVNDGHILSKPKRKIVGVSLVSYSTPPALKRLLSPVVDIALEGGETEVREYIHKSRHEFAELDPVEFARTAKVNNLNYMERDGKYKRQKEDGTWLTAPLGSTAALNHNKITKMLNIQEIFPPVEKGDSLSYVYIKEPNKLNIRSALGWTDPKLSKKINLKSFADYDLHWEKDFINKIDIIIKPLNWNIHARTQEIDEW